MKERIRDFKYLGFVDNLYLSTTGTLTACYKCLFPPIYSMSPVDYEVIYGVFKEAFSYIEENVLVHKQDVFLRSQFDEQQLEGNTFLAESKRNRFSDTEYMEHYSFISFSIKGLSSLERAYMSNPLKFKQELHVKDKKRALDFDKQVKTVVTQLNQIAGIQIKEASQYEIKQHLFNYYTLFGSSGTVRDFWTEKDFLTDGKKQVCGYVLSDESQLPNEIKLYSKASNMRSEVNTNDTDEVNFLQTMFCEDLGISLHYSHILNSFWLFNKSYISDFKDTVSKFKRYRGFSKDLSLIAEQQDKLLDKLNEKESILCEYSFNILLVEEKTAFDNGKDKIEEILETKFPKIYQPTGEGIDNLFFGSMIGFENFLNESFFFLTNLETALSFNTFGSQMKSDNKGFLFNERNCNSPIKVDLWNKPFGIPIKARNGIIVSTTGGGKSVLALSIIRQLVEDGTKVIVLEIGKSFEMLTKIYKDRAIHIKYSADADIGFNPFKLEKGQTTPSHEQLEQITDLIRRFLQQGHLDIDKKAQEKTIEEILLFYYRSVSEERHSFDTFYKYVEDNQSLLEDSINSSYFNIPRFLLVCQDFIKGGKYYKLAQEGDGSLFTKDLIVIELSDIKGNQFLFGYIMYVLTLLIDRILLDRGVKSLFFIDEYGEIQDKETSKDDSFNIHATTAYCYQKLRKENSACYIGIQHAKQLKDDNYTQTILTQADLLYIPQTNPDVYKQILEVFDINNKTMINQIYSMCSHKGAGIPIKESYTEIFVAVAKKQGYVLRLCLSEEEFYCFQTDGDKWDRMSKKLNEGIDIKQVVKEEIEHTL